MHILTVTVLNAVNAHPLAMSPILLEYLLRGEVIGRMAEKGLLESPYHGVLADTEPGLVAGLISEALGKGFMSRGGGFYPALKLTPAGENYLAENTVVDDMIEEIGFNVRYM